MESWILYSLISGTMVGFSNFILKPIGQENLNKHKIFLYSSILWSIIGTVYILFNGMYLEFGVLLFFCIIIRQVFALEKGFFTVEGLKYMESSLFFPINRIVHIILSFGVGVMIFGEYLDTPEYVAIVLGIFMISLLLNKKNKSIQVDYKKGVFYLMLTNAVLIVASTINKYISISGFDIPTYLFLSANIGLIYILLAKRDIYTPSTPENKKKELYYGLFKGVIGYIGFFFVLMALKTGPLVLVQMIHGSSIFIPIILSVIFYHEKITLSKFISLILFVIILLLLTFF